MSTAAWITSEVRVQDSAISRELLANCMSAQQLSKEWVDGFIDILKEADVSEEDYTIVHAVRSIARDESLGNPTILRKLNPNEILTRAKAAEEERAINLEKQHQNELKLLAKASEESAREEERRSIAGTSEARSESITDILIRTLELVLAMLFVFVLVRGFGSIDPSDYRTWIQPLVFIVVTLVTVLDLFQFQPIRRLTNPARRGLKRIVHRILYGE